MRWLLNSVYLLLLTILSPMIAWRIVRHGRYRKGIAEKLRGLLNVTQDGRPIVWFHAVSVGEVIQLQKVVDEFRRQTADRFAVLVSTSTDTGFELARKKFSGCQLAWFPLDFSWAVRNAVLRVQPVMVVLVELELWPNFLAECHQRAVPVAVINARMSERSHRRYRRVRPLLARMFSRLALVAAQSQTYADRLMSLGVSPDRIRVTGSIKFDAVDTDRANPKTEFLRQQFGLQSSEIVFVAGSTQDPEEQLALSAWLEINSSVPELRLILVPRHRERFEAVARLVIDSGVALLRRSQMDSAERLRSSTESAPVILLDTIGELSACWGLADIAFVGGSFVSRGGQNMIEPAAYGACVMYGPNTWNFRDVVECFREASACIELGAPEQLRQTLQHLVTDRDQRLRAGRTAQNVVRRQQGATRLTVSLLCQVLAADRALPVTSDRAA